MDQVGQGGQGDQGGQVVRWSGVQPVKGLGEQVVRCSGGQGS